MNHFKLCLLIFTFTLFGTIANAEVLDRVIATIGSEPVTLLEVKGLLNKKPITVGETSPTQVDIKEAILILLFRRESSRLGISITDEDVNDYIRRVEASNGGGEGNIEQALAAQGMTLSSYKEKVKLELEKSRILAMNLRSQVQVSDEEVSKYLGKGVETKVKEDGFYLAQIICPKDIEEPELEKIKTYLKDNKKCFTPQEIKAQCTSMGEVEVKDLKEEIKELVDGLDIYEASKLGGSDSPNSSVFYMRVEANFGSEDGETFSKVKEQIYQKKFMEKANQFVSKDIFEKYAVEIY